MNWINNFISASENLLSKKIKKLICKIFDDIIDMLVNKKYRKRRIEADKYLFDCLFIPIFFKWDKEPYKIETLEEYTEFNKIANQLNIVYYPQCNYFELSSKLNYNLTDKNTLLELINHLIELTNEHKKYKKYDKILNDCKFIKINVKTLKIQELRYLCNIYNLNTIRCLYRKDYIELLIRELGM